MRTICIATMAWITILVAQGRAAEPVKWPQFRGPDSRGVVEGVHPPDKWSATENVAWTQSIPGRGWSSPIVWGDRVFLTTVVKLGEAEEPKRGLYFGGNRTDKPKDPHQWKVYCLDLHSGEVLWNALAYEGVPEYSIHIKNSYASETPVTDGRRVYVYFGNVGVFAYDFNGKLVWKKDIEPVKTRYSWGTASSPVLHDGRLFIVNDNDESSYLLALDAESGDEIFRIERDEKSNWATPYVWVNPMRTELVTAGTNKVRSYSLDGELLWELSGMSSIAIPTPFARDGLLYVASGYVLDKKKPVFAIKPGASGDISLAPDETSNEYIEWFRKDAGPYNPSPLLYGDYLYVLLDRGFLTCYNAKTGEQVYGRKRLPGGKAFTASPWAYDGKVFCLSEYGETFVVRAGPDFEILHVNRLEEDSMAMATPAIAGDRLILRTDQKVYCIAPVSSQSENKKADAAN